MITPISRTKNEKSTNMALLIGRGGKTVDSLRHICKCVGLKYGLMVKVFVDNSDSRDLTESE
jgi:predicted RNA-binding protein Jag